ncbi:MAG TPA: hypothetical protein VGM05_05710 [Planctomycetaceae bacterium]
MKRESAKESYAVWIPEEILEAGYPPVYEVPFAELSDDVADALGYPEWCRTVRADPEVGWAQGITIDPEASNAERSVASEFRKYIPVALTVCDGTALWTVGHKDEPRGRTASIWGPGRTSRTSSANCARLVFVKVTNSSVCSNS